MPIETELDDIHAERLTLLQRRLQKPLAEILAAAIDKLAFSQPDWVNDVEPSPLLRALEKIGFVGCIEADENLATHYKKQLDFSDKCGKKQ